jgi:hypothetical protein
MGYQSEPLMEIEEKTVGDFIEDQNMSGSEQKCKELYFPVTGIAREK